MSELRFVTLITTHDAHTVSASAASQIIEAVNSGAPTVDVEIDVAGTPTARRMATIVTAQVVAFAAMIDSPRALQDLGRGSAMRSLASVRYETCGGKKREPNRHPRAQRRRGSRSQSDDA